MQLTTRRRRAILIVICAAYYLLAIGYSIATPILEPYDEPFHFAVLTAIGLDHGLPVQDVEHPAAWGNEGSQPPLYYAIMAAATAWTLQPGFATQVERNPYTTRHLAVEFNDNRNLYVHRGAERFPYSGNVLAIHLVRALTALLGVGTLLATYATTRTLFPSRPVLALGATAFLAFIPSFIYVSSSVNNDALVVCLASLVSYCLVRCIQRGKVSILGAAAVGALIGLAVLSKLSALPLAAAAGVALWLIWRPADGWRSLFARETALLGGFMVVAGWWFARNVALYHELLGTDTMNQIAGLRPTVANVPAVLGELPQIERTFWAAFGTGNVHPDALLLMLPRIIALVGLAGFGIALLRAVRTRRLSQPSSNILIAVSIWVGLFLASWTWWLFRITGVSGRLLFPLLLPFVIAIAFGIAYWGTERFQGRLLAAGGAGMFLMAASMPVAVIMPAFAPPDVVSENAIPESATESDVTFGDLFRLRAFALPDARIGVATPLHAMLYWQASKVPQTDYTVYLHVLGRNDELLGGVDTFPGRGAFLTPDWKPGFIYQDSLAVYLDKAPVEPVAARLLLGWYETRSNKSLPAKSLGGNRLGALLLGRVRVAPGKQPEYHPSHMMQADFNGQINLVGYDRTEQALTLYWRAAAATAKNYTVFIHVLDLKGGIIAQADGQPDNGDFPSSYWQAGDVVRDAHAIQWPAHFDRIEVGVYDLASGARLQPAGQTGDVVIISESR